jgi:hypothetical protein
MAYRSSVPRVKYQGNHASFESDDRCDASGGPGKNALHDCIGHPPGDRDGIPPRRLADQCLFGKGA